MKIVKNDLFDYKNRYIYQLEDGFKFSLDAILLAEYTKVKEDLKILDMCTGNGVVPLILSTKTNSEIVGFEIQEIIANIAKKSVQINKLDKQITIINDDIKNIQSYYKTNFFDIITCNPPYFKKNSSLKNINEYKNIARHEIKIDLEEIFKLSYKNLKDNGILYLSHRPERLDEIITIAINNNMGVKEIVFIMTKNSENSSLILIKCVKNSKRSVKIKIKDVSKCSTYQHIF